MAAAAGAAEAPDDDETWDESLRELVREPEPDHDFLAGRVLEPFARPSSLGDLSLRTLSDLDRPLNRPSRTRG